MDDANTLFHSSQDEFSAAHERASTAPSSQRGARIAFSIV